MRIVASPCPDEMNCSQDILQNKFRYAKKGKKKQGPCFPLTAGDFDVMTNT